MSSGLPSWSGSACCPSSVVLLLDSSSWLPAQPNAWPSLFLQGPGLSRAGLKHVSPLPVGTALGARWLLRLEAQEHLFRHRLHRKVTREREGHQYVLDLTRAAAPIYLFLSISYPPLAFIQGNFYVASCLGLKHCSQKILCSPGIFSRDEQTNILQQGERARIQVRV